MDGGPFEHAGERWIGGGGGGGGRGRGDGRGGVRRGRRGVAVFSHWEGRRWGGGVWWGTVGEVRVRMWGMKGALGDIGGTCDKVSGGTCVWC